MISPRLDKATRLALLRGKLTQWGQDNTRKFPWRENPSPYKVIVSEILLQQTFAKKVVPPFEELIGKYPTVQDLAAASPSDVERIIRPLGLFYRAKVLVEASKQVVEEFGGDLPQTKGELLKIKGVGDYVSSAVLCFAFDKKVIPIDTNISRVICRVFGLDYPVKTAGIRNQVKELCETLAVPLESTKVLSYGVLDLAATVCKFYNPICEVCPLKDSCKYGSKRLAKGKG